jgi:hypothetical protein
VFYCEECCTQSPDRAHLSVGNATARVVPLPTEAPAEIERASSDRLVEPLLIVGWEEVDDYPSEQELCRVALSNDELEFLLSGLDNKEIGYLIGGPKDYYEKHPKKRYYALERCLDEADLRPRGSKLAGWPHGWIKYPNCRVCQQPMNQLIFYVSPEHLTNREDLGLTSDGYVLQCPTHKEEVIYVNCNEVSYDRPWVLFYK